MSTIRVGIGGWTFAPWRGRFFPAGLKHADELRHASGVLSAIEINGTFYRHQSEASFAKWRDETPEGFRFTVKAHRATTHGRDLAAAGPAIERFLGSGLTALGPKLGPILWQFPPTKKFEAEAFAAFLAHLPATVNGLPLRHAVEARHPSFADAAALSLLRKKNVASAVIDSDKQALAGDLTADFVYARLQRNDEAAAEGYASEALDRWADRARAWAAGRETDLPRLGEPAPARPRDVFLFFISGDKVRAPDAAQAMLARLAR